MLWKHTEHGLVDVTARADRRKTMPHDLWRPSICTVDKHYCTVEHLFLPLEDSPDAAIAAVHAFLLRAGWTIPTPAEIANHHAHLHSAS